MGPLPAPESSTPRALPAAAARLRRAAQLARAIGTQPRESLERICEKAAEHRDARGDWPSYEPAPDAEELVHAAIGAPWPCPEREGFDPVWSELTGRLSARGQHIGRGMFGGWDDGDAGLVRMAWCLTRHLQPSAVVETGVARGLTTAAVLRALARNGRGHLWSIDLPPLAERGLSSQTGMAVADDEAARWTLLHGSSRTRLRRLVRARGTIDLFIHDSMHTGRNVTFELGTVWPALAPGGALLVDDVERNAAFALFTRTHPESTALVCPAKDDLALFGCAIKPGDGSAEASRSRDESGGAPSEVGHPAAQRQPPEGEASRR